MAHTMTKVNSVMERKIASLTPTKRTWGLQTSGRTLIMGRDIPDLMGRPADLALYKGFFGGEVVEVPEDAEKEESGEVP